MLWFSIKVGFTAGRCAGNASLPQALQRWAGAEQDSSVTANSIQSPVRRKEEEAVCQLWQDHDGEKTWPWRSNHAPEVAGKSVCLCHFAPCPQERITCLKMFCWTTHCQDAWSRAATWYMSYSLPRSLQEFSSLCCLSQVWVVLRQWYLCWADRYRARIVYCSFHALIWEEKASTWYHLDLFSSLVLFVKDTAYLVRNNGFLFH